MKTIIFFLSLSVLCVSLPSPSFSQEILKELMVADFNSGTQPNNIGGVYGTWDYDPNDDTQTCVMNYEETKATLNAIEYALRLDYDVQSPNPAFNGFWMKLEGNDLSEYTHLRFLVKGDGTRGFTSRFKVELKNALGKRAIYLIKNVTDEWSEVLVDFKKTKAIQDWTNMSEFTIVFSDLVSTYKEGTIYIDSISFVSIAEVKE
jgi:hypothetical protein